MSKKIKWGIIGLGKIANKMAGDLILSNNSLLHGVASRDLEKAKAFGAKYKVAKCYSSYEALVKDPDINVVYIATPHPFHCEQTMMCLRNGKSVLCEKPMGMNASEVNTMIQEAQRRKLFLMEGLWTRFIPATEKLLELLNQKIMGDLISVSADFGFIAEFNPHGRIYNKALGGGSILDIGIYPIYLSLISLGVPTEIKAMARMSSTDVDNSCYMLFDYANGAKAILESTFEANTPTEAYIHGIKGTIKMHNRFHHTEKLSLFQNKALVDEFELPYRGSGYVDEIEEVERCISNNLVESPKLPHSISLQLATIMDQVKEKIGLHY